MTARKATSSITLIVIILFSWLSYFSQPVASPRLLIGLALGTICLLIALVLVLKTTPMTQTASTATRAKSTVFLGTLGLNVLFLVLLFIPAFSTQTYSDLTYLLIFLGLLISCWLNIRHQA